MIENYIYVIVALLPLAALMLVCQTNPYQALVIRGILGAVAALIYAVLGAADVALTEALVGTMLAITLYVIAVRSSLVMRLGIIKMSETESESHFDELVANLRKVINQYHLRLELVEYPNYKALKQALMAREVHASCTKLAQLPPSDRSSSSKDGIYQTTIAIRRLFEIMQTELIFSKTTLNYLSIDDEQK